MSTIHSATYGAKDSMVLHEHFRDTNKSIYEKYTGVSSEIIEQLCYIKELVQVDTVIVKVPHIPHFNTNEDVKHSIEILKGIGITHIKEITYMEHITHITK